MSVSGLCEVCEKREVVGGCERCARLVCEKHRDEETGYCTACYAEVYGHREARERGDDREGRDYPDGVGEYRF
jgi:hypothetical protein